MAGDVMMMMMGKEGEAHNGWTVRVRAAAAGEKMLARLQDFKCLLSPLVPAAVDPTSCWFVSPSPSGSGLTTPVPPIHYSLLEAASFHTAVRNKECKLQFACSHLLLLLG